MHGCRGMMLAMVAAIIVGAPTTGRAQNRGVQFTPDGKRTLVNKDIGTDRWAITLNENGSATGNVFRGDGGPPAFIFCAPRSTPDTFDCSGADACTDGSGAERGIQGVPDETRVLVQKDVGADRWAISLNFDDGTATGNIFRAGGGEPAFVVCTPTGASNTFDCAGADACRGTPCTEPFTPIATVTLPDSFFALPDPCTEAYAPLGTVTIPASFFEPGATIAFAITASAPVQAFLIRVTYAPAQGTFVGAGGDVSCTSDGGGFFVKNEDDAAGTLTLIVADAVDLTFPITLRCGFSAVGSIDASDFSVRVDDVTQNNVHGDTSVVTVGVAVP
jgi:hypothetical protein